MQNVNVSVFPRDMSAWHEQGLKHVPGYEHITLLNPVGIIYKEF